MMVALRTAEEEGRKVQTRKRQSGLRRPREDSALVSIFRPEGMAEEPLQFVRKDALVDSIDYRDTGCELARSCLACPLPRCQYDAPRSARMWLFAARDREIALLRRRHRVPVNTLARTYGLTRRTIFRILQEQRDLREPRP
jgi:hypothetical protein